MLAAFRFSGVSIEHKLKRRRAGRVTLWHVFWGDYPRFHPLGRKKGRNGAWAAAPSPAGQSPQ
jgi:hypothetical protein